MVNILSIYPVSKTGQIFVAFEKNQSGVWDEVEKVTEKQDAKTSTGTYTALARSDEYQNDLKSYTDYFTKSLSEYQNCIGFAGVSGDVILGCDVFASPELFQKQLRNLLNSYITEAISHGSAAKTNAVNVNKYLDEFLKDTPDQDTKIKEKGLQFEEKGKKLHINTY